MTVVLLTSIVAAGRDRGNGQNSEGFDSGLHQHRCALTMRRWGSMGSTDGVCDSGLFFSGSVQDRESSIRQSHCAAWQGWRRGLWLTL